MSRNFTRRIPEFHDEHCCAGNVSSNFRRTSSLRVRGEKMVQRSPLSTRKLISIPIITEHQKNRSDAARIVEPNHRPRSQSFSSNIQKPTKSCLKIQEHCMDNGKLSISDSAHTPPGSPEELPDDESLHSYGSAATAASMDAGYAPFNGTTFSGRSMRYVLHCSSHAGLAGEEYLTPTQRAQKQIRRLKSLLSQAKKDLDKKDSEIFHLTKEVVELRLYKASVCSPDEKSNSSEIVTIRENDEASLEQESPKTEDAARSFDITDSPLFKVQTPTRGRNSDMQGSFTDSGHFDDLTNSSLHSKESVHMLTHDASCMVELDGDEDRRSLISYYEKKVEDVMRAHVGETQELKKAHNDKVEALLQKLADVNTRYCELLPNYEQAKERIHVLEKQLEEVSKQLQQEDSRHRAVYLQMYKGVEAAKFDLDREGDAGGSQSPMSRVSVEELLAQLQITQTELENVRAMYRRIVESQKGNKTNVDPEVTLQFLKSAIYYFLTDPENHQGHLNAIENILGFTEAEKKNIRKARAT
ncbi:protein quick-to-court-like isoform X2 [Leguminivora glycinivorella]|uniref:protein quick-to-court-like isoform X2 n=1 Tax=Leguminivora glycinivorella TaxID=1035111 RepID=UPI00200C0353|nr:protein quick-to-court-like isoform X2 [Leguminivora glycinivorella]